MVGHHNRLMSIFQIIASRKEAVIGLAGLVTIALLLIITYAIANLRKEIVPIIPKDETFGGTVSKDAQVILNFSEGSLINLPQKLVSYELTKEDGLNSATKLAQLLGFTSSPSTSIEDTLVWSENNKTLLFYKKENRIRFYQEIDLEAGGFKPEDTIKNDALQKLTTLGLITQPLLPTTTKISFREKPTSLEGTINVPLESKNAAIADVIINLSIENIPIITKTQLATLTTISLTNNNEIYGIDHYFLGAPRKIGQHNLKKFTDLKKDIDNKNYTILNIAFIDEKSAITIEDPIILKAAKSIVLNNVELKYLKYDSPFLIPVFLLNGEAIFNANQKAKISIAVDAREI